MKRDWDLLRWLLNEAQTRKGGYPIVLTKGIYNGSHYELDIDEHDFAEVCEHILLLGDYQFAIVRDLGRNYYGQVGVAIDRLTAEGHEFLTKAQDDTRWKKAMKIVNEKGGEVTQGVLTQLLSALMKQTFGV